MVVGQQIRVGGAADEGRRVNRQGLLGQSRRVKGQKQVQSTLFQTRASFNLSVDADEGILCFCQSSASTTQVLPHRAIDLPRFPIVYLFSRSCNTPHHTTHTRRPWTDLHDVWTSVAAAGKAGVTHLILCPLMFGDIFVQEEMSLSCRPNTGPGLAKNTIPCHQLGRPICFCLCLCFCRVHHINHLFVG